MGSGGMMETNMNTTRLIRHMARGVSRFRPALFEDLVQTGEIALWHASKSWRGENGASLWTYARRSVVRDMLRLLEAELSEPASPQDRKDENQGIYGAYRIECELSRGRAVSPADEVEVAELIAILRDLVHALPDAAQALVQARFVDELDVRAIADRLDISKSEADRRYHAVVAKLRTAMAKVE